MASIRVKNDDDFSVEDTEFDSLLNEDQSQTQEELAKSFGVALKPYNWN